MTKWDQVHALYGRDCQSILLLMDLIMSIPASSAENERGFSVMKMTKNVFRASLNTCNLQDRIAICLLTPDVPEYDPSDAVDHWLAQKSRRSSSLLSVPVATGAYADEDSDSDDDESISTLHGYEWADVELTEVEVDEFLKTVA